jgi:rubrerythrin
MPELRDIAVERVRASGGPLDQASYACQCGYLFAAPVTTTVSCPHCSAPQAW